MASGTRGSRVLREHEDVGTLAAGKLADFIVVNGDPVADVGVLLKPGAIEAVYLGGRRTALTLPTNVRRHPWERSYLDRLLQHALDTFAFPDPRPVVRERHRMGRSKSSDVMMWPSLPRTIAASIGLMA